MIALLQQDTVPPAAPSINWSEAFQLELPLPASRTLPLKQWDVARELRRRIKNRFDRDGIEIPFPHTTFCRGEGQKPVLAPTGADQN
jgi:small-conductance mechanosensitive channel